MIVDVISLKSKHQSEFPVTQLLGEFLVSLTSVSNHTGFLNLISLMTIFMASLIPKEPEKFSLNKENIAHYRENCSNHVKER